MDEELKRRLDRIEKHLAFLVRRETVERRRKTWVKVGVIKNVTGWDKEQLRRARDSGMIAFKHEDGAIRYLLESIHPMLLKTNINDRTANNK